MIRMSRALKVDTLFIVMMACGCFTGTHEVIAKEQAAGISIELRRSVLAYTFVGQGGLRYFACELLASNHAETGITVSLTDARLIADGTEYTPEFKPESLSGYSLHVDDESIHFRDLPQDQDLTIPRGEQRHSWLVFTNLPALSSVPQMVVQLNIAGTVSQVDINESHARMLKLTHEQIGPGKALGFLRIDGKLDTVNVGTLASLTDELASKGVSRIVLSFADSVGPISEDLRGWVQQIAEENGTARQYSHFPAIAPSIREIHVAGLPGHNSGLSPQSSTRRFIHPSEASAVEGALEPVFRYLPSNQVVEQIRVGDRLVRAAALATSADRLDDHQLPMIVELAAGDDPVLRRAACLALREFHQPLAVDTLVQHARRANSTLAVLAVECLAASRFSTAHEALANLLKEGVTIPPDELSRILSSYPRQQWLDALTRFAIGEFTDGHLSELEISDVRRDALLALSRIGHPQFLELLSEALDSDDSVARETAFSLLIAQEDDRSHQLAIEAALARIESTFPSHQILLLLERRPDARAVPLLIKHLKGNDQNRSNLIKTLARIGGPGIDQTIAQNYSTLEPREQSAVLNELSELQSDQVIPLAGKAIQSDESILFNTAVAVLQGLDDPAAVAVLLEALNQTTTTRNIHALTRALSEIGTTDAINALRQARILARDQEKLEHIVQMLTNLESRSPGQEALRNAKQHAENEDWSNAIDDYDIALELDPELTSAYSGRGHSRLQLDRLDAAAADFRSAMERNPFDGMAVTGLGIVLVRQGDPEAGIKLVEEAAERFRDDWVFSYNTACVYGRAVEAALGEEPSRERDGRIKSLQTEAMEKLKLSAEQGLPEFDYMKRDPDLKVLWNLPEFKELKAPEPADPDS